MFRYFIYLSFDGTNYHGWQIQPNGASVQETLMKALSTFLRREIEVVGAGRTDAGVHALGNVAVFDTSFHQTIPEERFLYPIPYVLFQINARHQNSYLKDYNLNKELLLPYMPHSVSYFHL